MPDYSPLLTLAADQPLSKRSVAELRAQAEQYRHMAATARYAAIENSLLKLAIRFDGLADQREKVDGD